MPSPRVYTRIPLEDRFWPKVEEVADGCWLWTGGTNSSGYGVVQTGGRADGRLVAHRFAYEYVVGVVPPGLDLDHLCRVRHCVNPAHLEPVTRGENIRRGAHATVVRLGVCKRGHPMRGGNVYRDVHGNRYCRRCAKRRRREYHERTGR